jgi:hypothetical protein
LKEFRVYICEGFAQEFWANYKGESDLEHILGILSKFTISPPSGSLPINEYIRLMDANKLKCEYDNDIDEISNTAFLEYCHYYVLCVDAPRTYPKNLTLIRFKEITNHNIFTERQDIEQGIKKKDNILRLLQEINDTSIIYLISPYLYSNITSFKDSDDYSFFINSISKGIKSINSISLVDTTGPKPTKNTESDLYDNKTLYKMLSFSKRCLKRRSDYTASYYYKRDVNDSKFSDRVLITNSIFINLNHYLANADGKSGSSLPAEVSSIMDAKTMKKANSIIAKFTNPDYLNSATIVKYPKSR